MSTREYNYYDDEQTIHSVSVAGNPPQMMKGNDAGIPPPAPAVSPPERTRTIDHDAGNRAPAPAYFQQGGYYPPPQPQMHSPITGSNLVSGPYPGSGPPPNAGPYQGYPQQHQGYPQQHPGYPQQPWYPQGPQGPQQPQQPTPIQVNVNTSSSANANAEASATAHASASAGNALWTMVFTVLLFPCGLCCFAPAITLCICPV